MDSGRQCFLHPGGWIPPGLRGVAALCFSFLVWAAPGAGGQEREKTPAPARPTLKISVEIVNVYVVVREKKGRLIPNLNREDFEVTEDNAGQEIRYFSRETDTPLTLGVLVDTSPSQQRVLSIEKEEAKKFLGQVLRPKDMAFVLHFDLEVELLQDFTSDVRLLSRAIDDTVINGGGHGVLPEPLPTKNIGGTHLYDAVYLASNELMRNEVGRKVLILLTDGEDQGSEVKLNAALEAAQKVDVIIYSIDIVDRAFYGRSMGFVGDSVLRKLSEETGGHVIQVNRAKDTAAAFQEIAEEMRTQYLIGYTPSTRRHDGSYHKIRVRVPQTDYKVQARRGYYAPSE
jgi:VWFA-related protein